LVREEEYRVCLRKRGPTRLLLITAERVTLPGRHTTGNRSAKFVIGEKREGEAAQRSLSGVGAKNQGEKS